MFLVLAQVAISVSSELSLELDRLANNRFTTPNVQHMVAVCCLIHSTPGVAAGQGTKSSAAYRDNVGVLPRPHHSLKDN